MRTKLDSARAYFEEVLRPAKEQFFTEESSFKNLYAMINALYHFHEWLWFFHEPGIKRQYPAATSKGKFWELVVETNVPDAGLIRDLNNTTKHVHLEIKPRAKGGPSRGAHHAANTEIQVLSSFSGGSLQPGSFAKESFGVNEHGKIVLLDTVAEALYAFWQSLIDKFEPPQQATFIIGSNMSSSANS